MSQNFAIDRTQTGRDDEVFELASFLQQNPKLEIAGDTLEDCR